MRPSPRSASSIFRISYPFRKPLPRYNLYLSLRFQSSSADDAGPSHPLDQPEQPKQPVQPKHETRSHAGLSGVRSRRRRRVGKRIAIGATTLGEPAEILVVQQQPRVVKHEVTASDEYRVPLAPMLDDLEEEMGALNPETVRRAFDEYQALFQPKEQLTPQNWNEIRSVVASSFRSEHLLAYLSESKLRHAPPEHGTETWRAGTSMTVITPHGKRTVKHRVASAEGLKWKRSLAERILRECWQLSMADDVGEQDLHLPPAVISLLLNAEHFSFDEVAAMHQSTIDVTLSSGFVRITGRQKDCEAIRELILDVTAKIREAEMGDVGSFTSISSLPARFLEWLGSTFGVAVKETSSESPPSESPRKIIYLAANQSGAEKALRTANLAIEASRETRVPFSTYLPASKQFAVQKYNIDTHGSWFDRQRSWFRWTVPSFQATSVQGPRTFLFTNHQSELSGGLLSLLRSPAATNTASPNGVSLREAVTASAGKCAFAPKSSFDSSPISAAQLGLLSARRTFTTDVPRVMPFLNSLPLKQSQDGSQSHRIRLIPPSMNANRLPELEVEFTWKPAESSEAEENRFDIRSVNLVCSTSSVDYLLPENSQDLRFTRTLYYDIPAETLAESSNYKALVESIKKPLYEAFISTDTIQEPVPLPPFCHIELPSDLLTELGYEHTGASRPSNQDESALASENNISVEYMLPPIENIIGAQIRHYDFRGRSLWYRLSETGPFLAASTTDVVLELNRLNAGSEEQDFHSFYMAACNMAFGIHKAYASLGAY
ncbi:uncharacterized protein N7459_004557 [Penicillium hispanicum]|uniref:uncharacterized protein n=1 Tax=Penicillium hispanicum TaxID=1080232 RepID=UPI00254032BD|nr:uncharacterized protein N7459_004557 [Penicillium hispanicum]KAJ5584757.1 hypothetical protein N7459_004557 [Penicillium hispanicum]